MLEDCKRLDEIFWKTKIIFHEWIQLTCCCCCCYSHFSSILSPTNPIDQNNTDWFLFVSAYLSPIVGDGSTPQYWLDLVEVLPASSPREWIWSWSNESATYTSWRPGQPNRNHEHAAWMHAGDGLWNDISTSVKAAFICEKQVPM